MLFADDVTQIIEYPARSKKMLALRTQREIERVNNFEQKWKIMTNKSKFKILSISKIKPEPIIIEHRRINFNHSVNIFRFNLGHKGFKVHINQRMAIARGTVTKLKRFKKLKPLTKRHL